MRQDGQNRHTCYTPLSGLLLPSGGFFYHGVAGEWVLELEDFVQSCSLGLPQPLLGHFDHEAYRGVRVVLFIIRDQSWHLIRAVQHHLQHVLLVGLREKHRTQEINYFIRPEVCSLKVKEIRGIQIRVQYPALLSLGKRPGFRQVSHRFRLIE